jgi:hypothetical protein
LPVSPTSRVQVVLTSSAPLMGSSQVVSYADLLKGKVRAGRRVAVIGAG